MFDEDSQLRDLIAKSASMDPKSQRELARKAAAALDDTHLIALSGHISLDGHGLAVHALGGLADTHENEIPPDLLRTEDNRRLERLRLLTRLKVDVNELSQHYPIAGQTANSTIAAHGSPYLITHAPQAGIDFNASMPGSDTIVKNAIYGNRPESIRALAKHVRFDVINPENGDTAAHALADSAKNPELVPFLASQGVDLARLNFAGESPYSLITRLIDRYDQPDRSLEAMAKAFREVELKANPPKSFQNSVSEKRARSDGPERG